MSRKPSASEAGGVTADPFALLFFMLAFIWLVIYAIAWANNVQTGGLANGAIGELFLMVPAIPILLFTFRGAIDYMGFLVGSLGVGALIADQAIFQTTLISPAFLQQAVQGIGRFAGAPGQLVYVTSGAGLVVTIGAYAMAEEGGWGVALREAIDRIFQVKGNWVKGALASALISAPTFGLFHTFVTVAAQSQLLNSAPLFGQFNFAVLLTPFGLSAMVARVILDTMIRTTKSYLPAFIAHPGLDMIVVAHAVGFF